MWLVLPDASNKLPGTAGKLRVENPGAIYHVSNRSGQREPVFRTGQDWLLFQEMLVRRPQRETTITLTRIVQRLNIGTPGLLANLLRYAIKRCKYAVMRD